MMTTKGRTALVAATEKMNKPRAEEQARFEKVVQLLATVGSSAARATVLDSQAAGGFDQPAAIAAAAALSESGHGSLTSVQPFVLPSETPPTSFGAAEGASGAAVVLFSAGPVLFGSLAKKLDATPNDVLAAEKMSMLNLEDRPQCVKVLQMPHAVSAKAAVTAFASPSGTPLGAPAPIAQSAELSAMDDARVLKSSAKTAVRGLALRLAAAHECVRQIGQVMDAVDDTLGLQPFVL
jgi:hypothetical protein